ncbi:MAG: hypothetical protein LBR22_06315 [Desulfovibrio sp.]|nr:hypothetical protein [Desulfovibrio sp.]
MCRKFQWIVPRAWTVVLLLAAILSLTIVQPASAASLSGIDNFFLKRDNFIIAESNSLDARFSLSGIYGIIYDADINLKYTQNQAQSDNSRNEKYYREYQIALAWIRYVYAYIVNHNKLMETENYKEIKNDLKTKLVGMCRKNFNMTKKGQCKSLVNATIQTITSRRTIEQKNIKLGDYDLVTGDSGLLKVSKVKNLYGVYINTVNAQTHTCEYNGVGQIVNNKLSLKESDDSGNIGDGSGCNLNLVLDNDAIMVSFEEANSCSANCGLNASFGGIYLKD